jgi:hypothetical protein
VPDAEEAPRRPRTAGYELTETDREAYAYFRGKVAAIERAQLAAATSPADALITLRATQAALFVRGMLLRWNTAALGPEPARRLLGELTTGRAAALSAFARTDHARPILTAHLAYRRAAGARDPLFVHPPTRRSRSTTACAPPSSASTSGSTSTRPGVERQVRVPRSDKILSGRSRLGIGQRRDIERGPLGQVLILLGESRCRTSAVLAYALLCP